MPLGASAAIVIFWLNPQREVVDREINVCQIYIFAHLFFDMLQYDLKVFVHNIFDEVFVNSNVVV